MQARDASTVERETEQRRAARRTALVLGLLAFGVYLLFVLQHFL